MLAPVGPAALCAAVLGLETARAALDLGQHRVAVQADIAQRLVCGPVLQLALLVATPHTVASGAPLHLAHMIDHVPIGLLNMLASSSKSRGKKNSMFVLATKHSLVDDERLLISRNGLVLLELVEQDREVVQRSGVLGMVGGVQVASELNSLLVAGDTIVPFVQELVANGHAV